MTQLIITVFAILLSSIMALVSVNYLPFWTQSREDTSVATRLVLSKLESSYNLAVQAGNGAVPAPTSEADGGLMTNFGSYLKFPPVAPSGFTWVYGQHPTDSSSYSGLAYFCMEPASPSSSLNQGQYQGLVSASVVYSSSQVIYSSSGCGATASSAFSSFPAKPYLTFYVTYTPGVY
jgi:hypothetical protein